MKNNIEKMIKDHQDMQVWHEDMAKSFAGMMQDHIKAAAWHSSQADIVKGMMQEVPLDPEKKVATIPTAGSASTPTSGSGKGAQAQNLPLDPATVKKSDLIDILKQHESEHGPFDMDVEAIAAFLINE